MEYTTIRISKENYSTLDDYSYKNRMASMDAALRGLMDDLARASMTIADLQARFDVTREERDQALELLGMTVPELHQAIQSKHKPKKSKK